MTSGAQDPVPPIAARPPARPPSPARPTAPPQASHVSAAAPSPPAAPAPAPPEHRRGARPLSGIDVVDHLAVRIRRPVDLLLLAGYSLALLALFGVAAVGTLTTAGLAADLSAVTHRLPRLLLTSVGVASGVVLLAYPVALAALLLVRRRSRLLFEAIGTAVVAAAAAALIGAALAAYGPVSVYQGLTLATSATARTAPFDPFLAGLVAYVTITRLGDREPWRLALLLPLFLGGLASIVGAQVALLSFIASLVLGRVVGLSVRYLVGTPSVRPPATEVGAALAAVGFPLASLHRREGRPDDARRYDARTVTGQRLDVTVMDADLQAAGAVYRLWRAIRLSADVARRYALSVTAIVERRALLTLLTEDAGVLCPELLAVVPVGPDAVAIATDAVSGRPLSELGEDLTDAHLRAVWRAVERLHQRRVTHRLLTADRILLDAAGAPVLIDLGEGDVAATDTQIRLDRAQLLVTLALLVGVQRAVDTGSAVVGDEELASVAPLIQPVVLSRPTRRVLRHERALLAELREHLARHAPQAAQLPPERVERFRPRTVLTLAAGIFAAYIIVGQLSQVNVATVIREADWRWAGVALVWSAVTYLGAAMALRGYVRDAISLLRTTIAQVAASFVSVVTPPAVGGVALNVRFLQRAGLPPAAAAATVGVSQVMAVAVHVLLLLLFAVLAGTSRSASLHVPGWAFIAVALIAVGVLTGLAIPAVRRAAVQRLGPTVSQIVPRLLDVAQRPRKLAEGIGGAVVMTLAYVLCLVASVHAFGGTAGLPAIAVVYLTGYAVGSAAPTPGGLGAVEAALSAGLVAAGVGGSAAVSAVLLFRLVTFWLPVPFGWGALGWLQRRQAL